MTPRTFINVWSPQLRNRRSVDVYLPASYSGSRLRYPVVYMQDGQNLADPALAFGGTTWGLHRTLEALAEQGLETIIVGVHHAGSTRINEYGPFPDRRHGEAAGDRYLAFLTDTLKPRIDRLFRTRADRDSTAILGSSMGGLISLYAFFERASVFGRAGAISPSLWYGHGGIFQYVEGVRVPRGRLYLDAGTQEGAATLRDVRRLGRLLVRRGFLRKRRTATRRAGLSGERRGAERPALRYVEAVGGRHGERDWAQRLSGALVFLLS